MAAVATVALEAATAAVAQGSAELEAQAGTGTVSLNCCLSFAS